MANRNFYRHQFSNVPDLIILHAKLSLGATGTANYSIDEGSGWISTVSTGATGQMVLHLKDSYQELIGQLINVSTAGFTTYVSTSAVSSASDPTVTVIFQATSTTTISGQPTYPTNSSVHVNLFLYESGISLA